MTTADRLDVLDATAHRWLVGHSMTLLRISLGAVFLGFGILKFLPGVSPAEDLATATTDVLMLGFVPGPVAVVLIGALKDVILVAAVLVVATTLRGGRIARGDHSAAVIARPLETRPFSAEEKLAVVMAGTAGDLGDALLDADGRAGSTMAAAPPRPRRVTVSSDPCSSMRA